MKYLALILMILSCLQVSAQSDATNKWSFSVGGGLAMPVGKYGKVDVQNTISVLDGYSLVEFFDKEDHSAAQKGYFLSASLARRMYKSFLVSVNVDYTKSSVSTTEINSYYYEILGEPFYYVFTQNNYEVITTYLGFGYVLEKSIWMTNIQPLIGWGIMTYPIYSHQVYGDESFGDQAHTILIDYQHLGPTPDPRSLVFGLSATMQVSFLKHLFVQLHAKYLQADFYYKIEPKTKGIDSRLRSDMVNYRIIDLGLSIGVEF
ncbi:MAG: hypothetical protein IIB82_15045 [Bacteroidetes bacterium]|nr:hypothetical protein [Bacteroidota bacterium]